MTKVITCSLAILLLAGCSATKELTKLKESNVRLKENNVRLEENNVRLEQRIVDLETRVNDSDRDGVPDYLDAEPNSEAGFAVDSKGRMVDLDGNGIADDLQKYVEEEIGKQEISAPLYSNSKTSILYSLKPTKQKFYDHFFNDKMSLLACHDKLTKKLKSVAALADYKYFETDGGFGIITDAKPVDGNPERYGSQSGRSNFIKKLMGMGDSHQNYRRVYIFLLIKKDLNEELLPNYDYIDKLYDTRELQPKWANIDNLRIMLNNPNNKFNSQEHSFVVRVYEFKKGQLQEDDQYTFIKGDNGYKIDPKVDALFTNKK